MTERLVTRSMHEGVIPLARPHAYLELDRSTGYLIRRSFRAVQRALEARLRPHGLSSSMWFTLRVLWERDGITQREIGEELDLGQPAIVSVIDTLERRGLLVRHRSTTDRRKSEIKLTPAGLRLREELSPVADQVNQQAVGQLTQAEIQTLWSLLDRVVSALEQQPQEAGIRTASSS